MSEAKDAGWAVEAATENLTLKKKIFGQMLATFGADAVLAATEGPLTADCPASALRNHAHVVLWLDAPAAAKLSKATIEGTEAKPE